jgi:16S rRNA (uracil1498-N3)-methyltransferase
MSERFFIETPISDDRAMLRGAEARHLAAVMRARCGDEVLVFDGSGAEFAARIERISKAEIELAIVSRHEPQRELPFALTLGVALPKGDRQKWLVEKATELGVTRIVPLTTQRGVAQPVEAALDRLRRSVIEASKQCGRNQLLEIGPPQGATDWFRSPSPARRLIAHPAGMGLSQLPTPATVSTDVWLAIGPEGGFTDHEVAAATEALWQAVTLGPRIMRVETAAIALAAWLTLSVERGVPDACKLPADGQSTA